MNARSRFVARAVTALAAALLAGCASSPPERFYTLDPPPAAAPAVAAISFPHSIIVGPVTLPERVDRPQFVVRRAPNRVALLEQHRWAEPLKAAIPRVLATTLARRLDGARLATHGQNTLAEADYRIVVDVEGFEGAPGEAVTVEARWSIRPARGEGRSGRSSVTEASAAPGYAELAAAYGRALAGVARDIAAALERTGHSR
jgi:uncharacterized lipoprotein YmbA